MVGIFHSGNITFLPKYVKSIMHIIVDAVNIVAPLQSVASTTEYCVARCLMGVVNHVTSPCPPCPSAVGVEDDHSPYQSVHTALVACLTHG